MPLEIYEYRIMAYPEVRKFRRELELGKVSTDRRVI